MKSVLIYTKEKCTYCEILKKYLTAKKVPFIELDIKEAPQEIRNENMIPITVVGNDMILGLNVAELNQLVGVISCKYNAIYLDNAATTKMKMDVFDLMKVYMVENFANASSTYSIGLDNKEVISETRKKIATILNCEYDEIFFTSGGSESNNMAIKGVAFANRDKGLHIITSKIEHPSILNACKWLETQGFSVTYLDVDANGSISIEDLKRNINDSTILISIMHANNEIGTIQDIKAIGEVAKRNNIYFHTDAVQTVGKLDIDLSEINVDLLSFSGHKIHGPKGAGVLFIKKHTKIDPLIHGGSQQDNLRAGTESVANIVALGKSLELSCLDQEKVQKRISKLSCIFVKNLKEKGIKFKVNGHPAKKIHGTVSVTFKDIDNLTLKFLLNTENIYISSGSACSENKTKPSHVLKSIGLSDDVCNRTVRFTLGEENTIQEIERTVDVISELLS